MSVLAEQVPLVLQRRECARDAGTGQVQLPRDLGRPDAGVLLYEVIDLLQAFTIGLPSHVSLL